MTCRLFLAAAAVVVVAGVSGQPAWAEGGVKAGSLTCNVDGGWGFVFGSSHDLDCTYTNSNGALERYTGHIDKFGVDVGYRGGGIIAWASLRPRPTSPRARWPAPMAG